MSAGARGVYPKREREKSGGEGVSAVPPGEHVVFGASAPEHEVVSLQEDEESSVDTETALSSVQGITFSVLVRVRERATSPRLVSLAEKPPPPGVPARPRRHDFPRFLSPRARTIFALVKASFSLA